MVPYVYGLSCHLPSTVVVWSPLELVLPCTLAVANKLELQINGPACRLRIGSLLKLGTLHDVKVKGKGGQAASPAACHSLDMSVRRAASIDRRFPIPTRDD